jgi:heat-inducible transcriptional repressor
VTVPDDRRLAVLRAVVEDYVATHEPVGSRALVERHTLGVSPATVRNDMAALEEEGYIAQPHTSAGRVPTDKGYRLFVDRLATVKPLSAAERRAINAFLDGAVDLDDVLSRPVRLLAQLTRQVAVVQYPSLTRSMVRHVELVPLTPSRLLVVVIASTGRVEQRVVELPGDIDDNAVAALRTRFNHAVANRTFAEATEALAEIAEEAPGNERASVAAVAASLIETVVERREERVVVAGTPNLTRFGQDFPLTVQPVLEALEEQVVLLSLLGEATTPEATMVRIGRENPVEGLSSTSVVTVGYGSGDQALAQLGIVGPTRMDYPGTIGAAHAVAQYLGRALAGE